jgi:hypothetical protein
MSLLAFELVTAGGTFEYHGTSYYVRPSRHGKRWGLAQLLKPLAV